VTMLSRVFILALANAALDRAEAGFPELTERRGFNLNDWVDWRYLHDDIVARHAVA